MLYQVTGTRIFLVPSLHQLPASTKLPDDITDEVARAGVVYLERDPSTPLPSLPGAPGCLSTTLPETARKRFEYVCNALYVDAAEAEALSPLEAANQIAALILSQRGWQASSGIDAQVAAVARQKVRHLESDHDLASAQGSVPLFEQVKELEYVISDQYLPDNHAVARAWFEGTENVLDADIEAAWHRAPRLAQRIYGDRNVAMTSAITTAISTKESAIFVVGVGHAYGGKGILANLKGAGIAVERCHG